MKSEGERAHETRIEIIIIAQINDSTQNQTTLTRHDHVKPSYSTFHSIEGLNEQM